MSFPVVWLEHRRWCSDQSLIDSLLTGMGGEHVVGMHNLPREVDGAVVVVPARYYAEQLSQLNWLLRRLDWAVAILTSDEESTFPLSALQHERLRVWVQTPRPSIHAGHDRFLGFGWPSDPAPTLVKYGRPDDQRKGWFFAGQVTHERRVDCVEQLRRMPDGSLLETAGFMQGMDPEFYWCRLAGAKVVPCPSGPATPDTFRVWEALEAGCLPLADGRCPAYPEPGYWKLVLGEDPPFPVVGNWADLPKIMDEALAGWPANANRAWAWWLGYKRDLARRFAADIVELSERPLDTGTTTVLIPTSPIPSHPDTTIIEETVASVRYHLPDADILVMCDGVRAEQEHRRQDYEEYLRRLMWLCAHEWRATPIIHDDHQHQANMTRHALTLVDTPLVLFVEHDTPLVTDEKVDWPAVDGPLLAGQLDLIRFHYEAVIPEPHRYLMLDDTPTEVGGCPVIRTRQFSARPHLARTDYYRRALAEHFPLTCRTFTEDRLHGVCQDEPWERNRLAIYAPGDNLKRSVNLDGRGDDPKAECIF